jgi:hypothetical protein
VYVRATPAGFVPQVLNVPAMTTVKWTNADAIPRGITFDVGRFGKHIGDRPLPTGNALQGIVFGILGEWPYHDTVTGHTGIIRTY